MRGGYLTCSLDWLPGFGWSQTSRSADSALAGSGLRIVTLTAGLSVRAISMKISRLLFSASQRRSLRSGSPHEFPYDELRKRLLSPPVSKCREDWTYWFSEALIHRLAHDIQACWLLIWHILNLRICEGRIKAALACYWTRPLLEWRWVLSFYHPHEPETWQKHSPDLYLFPNDPALYLSDSHFEK